MDRKEDQLEAQRYRRRQAAGAMFGAGPAHVLQTGPGPWAGPVLGLLVAGVLCVIGPVIDVVTKTPPSAGPVAPAVTPATPEGAGEDMQRQGIQSQDGHDAPH